MGENFAIFQFKYRSLGKHSSGATSGNNADIQQLL
jgi:hypothetical protein